MTFPWETKPVRPELIKDPVTGLYPGERDGIPGFLRRTKEGANAVVENVAQSMVETPYR